MAQKSKAPKKKPAQQRPVSTEQDKALSPPTEPAQVLGRHKNEGQKDHKGAR